MLGLGLNLRILGGRNAAHTEPRSHAVVCRCLCRAEPRIPEGPLPKAREQQAPVPLWPRHCLAVDSYCIPGSANIYPSCGRPVTPSTATLLTCPQLDLGNRNPGGGWDSHSVLAGTLGTDGFLLSLASMPARDPTRLAPSAGGRGTAALCPQITGRRNQCCWESLLSG